MDEMIMSNYQDTDSIEEILRGFEEGGEKINREDAELFKTNKWNDES